MITIVTWLDDKGWHIRAFDEGNPNATVLYDSLTKPKMKAYVEEGNYATIARCEKEPTDERD